MRTLIEEIDELLSRARYMEDKQPGTAIPDVYWDRVSSACVEAQKLLPETLKNVWPDESHKTWAEALLCLEAVNEVLTSPGA